jgi:hypothetical protein
MEILTKYVKSRLIKVLANSKVIAIAGFKAPPLCNANYLEKYKDMDILKTIRIIVSKSCVFGFVITKINVTKMKVPRTSLRMS